MLLLSRISNTFLSCKQPCHLLSKKNPSRFNVFGLLRYRLVASKAVNSFAHKLINENIPHSLLSMRVVYKDDTSGKSAWTILSRAEALLFAKEHGQDLVLVDAKPEPPVCKLETVQLTKPTHPHQNRIEAEVVMPEQTELPMQANVDADAIPETMKQSEKPRSYTFSREPGVPLGRGPASGEKKRDKQKSLKEMIVGVHIDAHDLRTKMTKTSELLCSGHSVKIVVLAKKRQLLQQPDCIQAATSRATAALEAVWGKVQPTRAVAAPTRFEFIVLPKRAQDTRKSPSVIAGEAAVDLPDTRNHTQSSLLATD